MYINIWWLFNPGVRGFQKARLPKMVIIIDISQFYIGRSRKFCQFYFHIFLNIVLRSQKSRFNLWIQRHPKLSADQYSCFLIRNTRILRKSIHINYGWYALFILFLNTSEIDIHCLQQKSEIGHDIKWQSNVYFEFFQSSIKSPWNINLPRLTSKAFIVLFY